MFVLFSLLLAGEKKSYESSQAPKAAVLPCSLFAVGSSSLACPWNPTVEPPARHLTQVSIAQMTTQTSAQYEVHQIERQKGPKW